MHTKKIHIFGGGTMSHVRAHLALCAPAYGTTMRRLNDLYKEQPHEMDVVMHPTRMADLRSGMVTNTDVARHIEMLIDDPTTQIIVFSTAMCDFEGQVGGVKSGKQVRRLASGAGKVDMQLTPTAKVIRRIRAERKDIFLVGFKTTTGVPPDGQFYAGLNLLKEASCNLVLANDIVTRHNMLITPEEARYHEGDREQALLGLVEMSLLRSHLTFTRSTVVDAEPVPWASELVPSTLRTIVDYCIGQGAYKEGPTGVTVGHFACKIGPTTFLTSRRKMNFNDMEYIGLVKVETDGPDSVIAYGSKPSVGGQSQRIIFEAHSEMDCVVHFHCPLLISPYNDIPVVSQREYECGSHECGQNTAGGLKAFGPLKCVMLDKHGPNIVFNRDIDPKEVINFIKLNFDLSRKTT